MLGGKNAEMFGLMFEILVQLDGGKKSRRELSEDWASGRKSSVVRSSSYGTCSR